MKPIEGGIEGALSRLPEDARRDMLDEMSPDLVGFVHWAGETVPPPPDGDGGQG